MTYSFDGFNYLIKLTKGEKLSVALEAFQAKTNLEGAWVSGLGGALEVTLGFYNLEKKEYQWRTLSGLREIASLQGNLAFNEEGKMVYHLHGVFSDEAMQCAGGHVKDLTAGATVELFIHRSYKPMHRTTDPEVGLQTLVLE